MRQAQWVAAGQVVLLFVGLSAARAGPESDQKTASYFTVKPLQVQYNEIIQIVDLDVSPAKPRVQEHLSLYCRVDIRDPNHVLGTYPGGEITRVTTSDGRNIDITSPRPFRQRLIYDRLQYQDRAIPPPAESRFRKFMRSTLRLPAGARFLPQSVSELLPGQASFWLDPELLRQTGSELLCVKGFFYALVAESIEQVDVPFEPNSMWVRLTPEKEVRLRDVSRTGATISFSVETRPPDNRPPDRLAAGDPLPNRLVTGLEFVPENGKPIPRRQSGPVLRGIGGPGGSPPSQTGTIKAIRFVIAVHPTHCRIPFELQHVPLPDPNQPPESP